MKRLHWLEFVLIVVIVGTHLYAAFSAPHNFSMRWYSSDDAYYYYKVAQNIVAGHGSSFDAINLTNGYHPLWLLICLPIFALAHIDVILPLRILVVVLGVLGAATSILLFRIVRQVAPEPVAILAACFWGLSLTVNTIVIESGVESAIEALAVMLFLYMLQNLERGWRTHAPDWKDLFRLGLAAVLVLFSRLDTIYLVLLAGAWMIFRRTSLRYFLLFDLLATFSIIVLAYIQRAGLDLYLLSYSNSALLSAGITFVIQTPVFYFAGLYRHPKQSSLQELALRTLIAVTASALLSAAVLLAIAAIGSTDLPRAVLLIYWSGAMLVALLSRLAVRACSPWEPQPGMQAAAPVQELRHFWKGWLREGLAYYGTLGIALGAYMLANRAIFGTALPVSGQIKRWWSTLPGGAYGGGAKSVMDVFALDPLYSQAWAVITDPIRGWLAQFETHFWNPDRMFWSVAALSVALGVLLILRRRRRNLRRIFELSLVPLALGAEMQAFFYGATGYAAEQGWYWVTQLLVLTLLAVLILSNLAELLPAQRVGQGLVWLVSAGAGAYLAITFGSYIYARMPYQDPWAGQPYTPILPIMENNTPPGSVIGMTGGGDTGYFIADRTIVNMDGLINSNAYFQALQAGTAAQFLKKEGVEYVFGNYYILTETMPYYTNFDGQLERMPEVPGYGNRELLRLVPKH